MSLNTFNSDIFSSLIQIKYLEKPDSCETDNEEHTFKE